MTNEDIFNILDSADKAALADLNDWGVNSVRLWARAQGFSPMHLVSEEAARILIGDLSLVEYLKISRAGSKFRLNGRTRKAIWALVKSREALAIV